MLNAKNIVQFDRYLNYQIDQKRSFELEVGNSDRCIKFEGGRGIRYRNQLSDEEMKMLWVFAALKKSARKRVAAMTEGFRHYQLPSKKWNRELYNSLEDGTRFVGIDINHAYLRTAFIFGYVSKRTYDKLMDAKYKGVRNKALACLNSYKKVYRYEDGVMVSSYEEGDPTLAAAYMEIRTCTYKLMNDVADLVGPELFLKYHTDCLYVLPEAEALVVSEIEKANYTCKVNKCIKMTGNMFADGDEIKDF